MPRLNSKTRLLAWILASLVALVLLVVAVVAWQVHRSVPMLDGQARVPGLQAAVTIARDERGTAVVKGASRLDVARGLGFVHAQERFFEMDLARRSAAGELSELFGPIALDRDRKRRLHRMRAMLATRYAAMDASDHVLLQAYADGVNAGLAQLGTKPWQYLMLRAEPRAWQPVDSLLVIAEMYWMLQGNSVEEGLERAQWEACNYETTTRWLEPESGPWDGGFDAWRATSTMPGPDFLDLRPGGSARPFPPQSAPTIAPSPAVPPPQALREFLPDAAIGDVHEPIVGSNNWAVDAAHSVSGHAMVANDMHLGLGVPATWFRAQFEFGDGASARRAEGLTLPGVPALVVGSTGRIAWGFTNTYGVWFEWVPVPEHAASDQVVHLHETIAVKGAAGVDLPITLFDGMPVAAAQGARSYALNWVADQGAAYNLKLDDLLGADGVEAATRVIAQAGLPEQNFVVADHQGRIAWTIAGPRFEGRGGEDETAVALHATRRMAITPTAADAPAPAPILMDPAQGLLWTANARTYRMSTLKQGEAYPDGAGLPAVLPNGRVDFSRAIGDGGVDLGARAMQIRSRLLQTPKFDESTLGAIHFDDEALFLRPWAARIAAATGLQPDVADLLKHWNGRADADQAGYRLVSEVRKHALDALWAAWSAPLVKAGQCADRPYEWHARFEYAAEDVLDHQPAHLLPHGFANWNAFLLAQVDATVADMTRHGARALAQATWGEANRSRIAHPLARAVPALSWFLDMPSLPQSGDRNMPHVAAPSFGQSERLVVAPGHEERATLSMPGGQSGHPMSPYYGAGHADWAAGRATPLLAGPPQHTLTLTP